MQYHEIGKTGMKVSSLSFGASSLGGVFHDLKEKEGIQAVFTAIEAGMNFIDVSPYYGHYKAATVIIFLRKSDAMAKTESIHGTTRQSVRRRVYMKVWNV